MWVLESDLAELVREIPGPAGPLEVLWNTPSGPPRGTDLSRRKLRQPFPPSPATISMPTSSTNIPD